VHDIALRATYAAHSDGAGLVAATMGCKGCLGRRASGCPQVGEDVYGSRLRVEFGPPISYYFDMQSVDLTLVREFRRRAERVLPGRVVRVVLYGSRARGDARPDSDWDIAVFLDGRPTPQDRRVLSDIGFDLMMESGQHFQTMAIDAARPVEESSFLRNVDEDGIAA
jgi:predicted nucleotidyltransferase